MNLTLQMKNKIKIEFMMQQVYSISLGSVGHSGHINTLSYNWGKIKQHRKRNGGMEYAGDFMERRSNYIAGERFLV